MTDRELLEYAAKAINEQYPYFLAKYGAMHAWNPLVDDGDALDLAVKLEIAVKFTAIRVITKWVNIRCQERYLNDRNTATRRAIVRAAAEVGKAMK